MRQSHRVLWACIIHPMPCPALALEREGPQWCPGAIKQTMETGTFTSDYRHGAVQLERAIEGKAPRFPLHVIS
ncbi:hypothetical protein B0T17DRAFT_546599, partial [Bombardia bombarda]